MKVALFNLIYQRYHKANEADSYTNVTLHQNVFFRCGEKVIFESDRKLSLGKEKIPFFSKRKCLSFQLDLLPLLFGLKETS